MGTMNHCEKCGAPVSRGSMARSKNVTQCLICQVKSAMRTFRYQSRAAQLRALGKQKEQQDDHPGTTEL